VATHLHYRRSLNGKSCTETIEVILDYYQKYNQQYSVRVSVMIYVRKSDDEVFTPLHLVPPCLETLAGAIGEKFGLKSSQITGLFRQNRKGCYIVDMILKTTYIIKLKKTPN